jgi:predicted PurR-regulated permease PerM
VAPASGGRIVFGAPASSRHAGSRRSEASPAASASFARERQDAGAPTICEIPTAGELAGREDGFGKADIAGVAAGGNNWMPDTAPPPPPLERELEAPSLETRFGLNTIFLGGLLLLALLAGCYVAADIALPIVLAFVLNAVLLPVVRALCRIGLPRAAAALLVVLALVALFVALGLLLSGPTAAWIGQLPETVPRIQERLSFLNAPIESLHRALGHIQNLAPGGDAPGIAVRPSPLAERVFGQIGAIAEGAFTMMLVLFFLLVSGETFLRRLVEILPDFTAKRRAVDISQQIEADISVYLATITVMNALVGVASGAMAWLCGLGDPLLWGTLAFLLNFVPILGPFAGVLIFLVAGLVTIDPLWLALMPAVLYLLIHVAEGETITPMRLAARFTVNPVLVILAVIFWYWMWGVVGAILATPLLAISKIVCDRIDGLRPVGHFIGGEPAPARANGQRT